MERRKNEEEEEAIWDGFSFAFFFLIIEYEKNTINNNKSLCIHESKLYLPVTIPF